jgi:hypothetical protein
MSGWKCGGRKNVPTSRSAAGLEVWLASPGWTKKKQGAKASRPRSMPPRPLGEKRPGVEALLLPGDVVYHGHQPLAVLWVVAVGSRTAPGVSGVRNSFPSPAEPNSRGIAAPGRPQPSR